ncbi:putative nuclease HARBI1 [Operophtera brumata]|uniref:Putative nuclease HARBI1 n=1 Tax=Operophtera brumata TaxID=104452 RepID=A0A0L7LHF8_OPEBR|nr:putative nuclease HARBI1 [Operophtera brumata]
MKDFVKFPPSVEEINTVKQKKYELAHFPGVIGDNKRSNFRGQRVCSLQCASKHHFFHQIHLPKKTITEAKLKPEILWKDVLVFGKQDFAIELG